MIRAYWWKGGPDAGNFGDELTGPLLELLSGQRVEHAPPEQADIIAIGSVLEPWFLGTRPRALTAHVWGSGRMLGRSPLHLSGAKVCALRGRLSRERVHCADKERVALGDPGLLCDLLIPPQRKTHVLGVVPHWTERQAPVLHRLAEGRRGVRIIDPCMEVRAVLEAIGSCERVLSSSLHGLVVADALGVPNEWLRLDLGDELRRGVHEFKFRDYYSVFGLEDKAALRLDEGDDRDSILARFGDYARPGLAAIQRGLLDSFPFRTAATPSLDRA